MERDGKLISKDAEKLQINEPVRVLQEEDDITQRSRQYVKGKLDGALEEDRKGKKSRELLQRNISASSWLNEQTVPRTEEKEKKIADTYRTVFSGRSLSRSQRIKRGKRFLSKAEQQTAVINEMKQYEAVREHALEDKATGFRAAKVRKGITTTVEAAEEKTSFLKNAEQRQDNPFSDLLRDYAAYRSIYGLDDPQNVFMNKSADLLSWLSKTEGQERSDAWNQVLMEFQELDLSEFDYGKDEVFINDLSRKYAKIQAFSHVKDILDYCRYHEIRLSGKLDLTALMAKHDVMYQIRLDYESRIKLMQSPYYVLLAGKDLSSLSFARIREMRDKAPVPGMKDYLQALLDRKGREDFGKGVQAEKLYQKTLAGFRKQDREKGLEELKSYEEQFEQLAKEDPETFGDLPGLLRKPLLPAGKKLKKGEEGKYFNEEDKKKLGSALKRILEKSLVKKAPLTHETIKKDLPKMSGGVSEGLEDDTIRDLNIATERFLNEEDYRRAVTEGTDDQLLSDVGRLQEEIIRTQSELDAYYDINVGIDKLAFGWDLKYNTAYSKEERDMIGRLLEASEFANDEITIRSRELSFNFLQSIRRMTRYRVSKGILYSGSSDYWEDCRKNIREIQPDHMLKLGDKELPFFQKAYKAYPYIKLNDGNYVDTRKLLDKKELKPKKSEEAVLAAYESMKEGMRLFTGVQDYILHHQAHVKGISASELLEYGNYLYEEAYPPLLQAFVETLDCSGAEPDPKELKSHLQSEEIKLKNMTELTFQKN